MFDKSSIYNLIEMLPIKGQSQATMTPLVAVWTETKETLKEVDIL